MPMHVAGMSRRNVVLTLLACTLIGGVFGLAVAATDDTQSDLRGLAFLFLPAIGAFLGLVAGGLVTSALVFWDQLPRDERGKVK
jgi:hypothetical protein